MYGNYNPYYMQPQAYTQPQNYMQQTNRLDPQPIYKPTGLQGKSVDSLEVVKAMDIPLDGSVSYFPLFDGTAIITKQLQQDGTSKTVVYKPIENEKETVLPKYVTVEDLDKALKKLNTSDLKEIKEEIKNVKRQIRDISEDIKDKKED